MVKVFWRAAISPRQAAGSMGTNDPVPLEATGSAVSSAPRTIAFGGLGMVCVLRQTNTFAKVVDPLLRMLRLPAGLRNRIIAGRAWERWPGLAAIGSSTETRCETSQPPARHSTRIHALTKHQQGDTSHGEMLPHGK